MPLSSPEHLNWTEDNGDDIWSEEPPSDMAEMAITEKLHQVQVQRDKFHVTKKNIFSNPLEFLLRSKPVMSKCN